MDTKNQTQEIRTAPKLEPLYEEYLKNTVEFYTGHSCFESKCKGKMEAPTNPNQKGRGKAGHLLLTQK
ncbi:unnamed protein product [marine sediment metagenome]|uniref:Uncharacterized protein n=1 Tax=marine sediment metagenome TaxID=412755 RepID=X1A927_9ZZZZ